MKNTPETSSDILYSHRAKRFYRVVPQTGMWCFVSFEEVRELLLWNSHALFCLLSAAVQRQADTSVRMAHVLQARVGPHSGEGPLRPEETRPEREARLLAERHRRRAEKNRRHNAEVKRRAAKLFAPEPSFVPLEMVDSYSFTARLPTLDEYDERM